MKLILEPRIDGRIEAEQLRLGNGVIVEEGALITGPYGAAKAVILGDFCYIGRHTRVMVPEFRLGDYSKLHAFSFARGYKPLQIGHCCWIGGSTVLDSIGGLLIDDNVCVSAHCQVWTHIQFGDIVEGCRFYSNNFLYIQKDAWFGGHCIVTPVTVGAKSMALAGSVITKDMLPNHIYAGVPAKDVTDKLGHQFEERSVDQKADKMQELIDAFILNNPKYKGQLMVVRSASDIRDGICCFDVSRRTYTKTYSEAEVAFLKAHVPLVKFAPDQEPPFVAPQQAPDQY